MNDSQLALIAYFALGAALTVALIGKERKPTTPGVAVIMLAIYAALIYAEVRT